MGKVTDMLNSLGPAKDANGYTVSQSEYDELLRCGAAWHPIETAPHDRQVLLHKDGGDMHVGRWVNNPYTGDEAFAIAELGEHGRAIVHPTHWAELPMPPNT